jgi:small GTP-binding protein
MASPRTEAARLDHDGSRLYAPLALRLADVIGQWIGRVELVVAGADGDLREGQDALSSGDAIGARAAAHRVLERAPDSALGLALLADACDALHLDAELALALEELARRAASRPEVWVRLGRARSAIQAPALEVRDAFARALAVAESGSDARREALLALADLDLVEGEAARAELWLERLPSDLSAETAVRRAEARISLGDAQGALGLLDAVQTTPTDGRAALVRGRALSSLGDAAAFPWLLRAMVLDVPESSEALSDALAHGTSDGEVQSRISLVVGAKEEASLARWRAAFASARGERHAAREALREAVASGDASSARPLVDAAMQDRDPVALRVGLSALPAEPGEPQVTDARALASALTLHGAEALEAVATVTHPRAMAWAKLVATDVVRAWLPPAAAGSAWADVLARLGTHARAIEDREGAASLDDLSAERGRPLRIAVVGEFNAGKSTFINALLGAEVAAVGIVPTTATSHLLRWGQVDVVDTPGFNALDSKHADLARAALDEADMALWLLDATQALKESERAAVEDAQRRGLPFLVTANKRDRLSPEDLRTVMARLDGALAEAGLTPWAPPWAVSAKKALAGKLGDPAALEASGWPTTERVLQSWVLSRSDQLKERTLRRRARAIASRLLHAWTERAKMDEELAARAAEGRRALARSVARLEADEDALAGRLAGALAPAAAGLAGEMRLVLAGRDAESAARDFSLVRYRVERAIAVLVPVLLAELGHLAPGATGEGVETSLRALVRGAVGGVSPDADVSLMALARGALRTWVEHALARASARDSPSRARGAARELDAFVEALSAELPKGGGAELD